MPRHTTHTESGEKDERGQMVWVRTPREAIVSPMRGARHSNHRPQAGTLLTAQQCANPVVGRGVSDSDAPDGQEVPGRIGHGRQVHLREGHRIRNEQLWLF